MRGRKQDSGDELNICKQFGCAVRQRRMALGLTQEELAARSGLHRTYIGDIERGARNIALKNVVKIAVSLETTLVEFVAAELTDF